MKKQQAPVLKTSPFEYDGGKTKLAPSDKLYLEEREKTIEQGRETFLDVGRALLEIREYKGGVLYKDRFGTFENYCRERWEFGRSYASRLITAAEVVTVLLPRGNTVDFKMPTSEKQIRALGLLEKPEDRRKAWEAATEKGDVTSTVVAGVVREMIAEGAKPRSNPKPGGAKPVRKFIDAGALKVIRACLAEIRSAAKGVKGAAGILKAADKIRELLPS